MSDGQSGKTNGEPDWRSARIRFAICDSVSFVSGGQRDMYITGGEDSINGAVREHLSKFAIVCFFRSVSAD